MGRISLLLTISFILLTSFAANAELNMGGKSIFSGTVIEVLEPGPATQIQAIITDITDASASNPYLIQLGPGVYDLGNTQIVMKEWVSLQGAGQEATKITSADITNDATSAVVLGADNADLTDLTIVNTSGSSYSIAILNEGSSPRIERVTATASGAGTNIGIRNRLGSSPVMINVTTSASGGVISYGVSNIASAPIMTHVTASASDGSSDNTGVRNFNVGSPVLADVTATASGGSGTNIGIDSTASSTPVMTNITAIASGGSVSVGVVNSGSYLIHIKDSTMQGDTYGLHLNSPAIDSGSMIVNSMIIGGVQDSSGTQCRGNYDENLADVTC